MVLNPYLQGLDVLSLKSMHIIKTMLLWGDELHNSKQNLTHRFSRISHTVQPGVACKSGSSAKPSGGWSTVSSKSSPRLSQPVAQQRDCSWDFFPGGPLVKNLPCNAGHAGPMSGCRTKIPHAMEQLSPQAMTTESKRHDEKIPRDATKTRHSQISK